MSEQSLSDTMHSANKVIHITQTSFDERPAGVNVDSPLVQLKDQPDLDLEHLFESYGFTPSYSDDELGLVREVVFISSGTNRWFHAYERTPSDGVYVETSATSPAEMYNAFNELLGSLKINQSNIEWVSPFVEEGKAQKEEASLEATDHMELL